jgi:hypothetical protein
VSFSPSNSKNNTDHHIQSVAQQLQTHYFDANTGQYNGGSLWTDAVRQFIFKIQINT